MSDKIPIKRAEISVQRFNDNAIPHHLGLLKNHKSNIEKCLALGDWEKIKKEEINATRVVKQLKNLLLEMDILRSKLIEEDVDKFDELIQSGREAATKGIRDYLDMKLRTPPSLMSPSYAYADDDCPEPYAQIGDSSVAQIQADLQLSEHQLRCREACLADFEKLQREFSDINDLFHTFHGQVQEQGESVTRIETCVEETQGQVEAGAASLQRALRYKKAMYPVCGALIGTCIGGPVGFLAGLKAGGLAAIGCGILGYTGGTVLKKNDEIAPVVAETGQEVVPIKQD